MEPLEATIEAIFLSKGHDFRGRFGEGRLNHETRAVDSVQCHAGRGLLGDRYYDFKPDYKGQMTLFAAEVAEALGAHLGLEQLHYASFRRNVITRGIDLNALIGKRFRLGPVILEGSEECAPCFWMDEAIGSGAEAWLRGRGGLRCRIHSDGLLEPGPIKLEVL